MPIVSLTYLKSKFENGDIPDQNDFIDLIDTLNAQPSNWKQIRLGTGNGFVSSFPLTETPLNSATVFVFVNGTFQIQGLNWNLVGSSVVMTVPVRTGWLVDATFL